MLVKFTVFIGCAPKKANLFWVKEALDQHIAVGMEFADLLIVDGPFAMGTPPLLESEYRLNWECRTKIKGMSTPSRPFMAASHGPPRKRAVERLKRGPATLKRAREVCPWRYVGAQR